MVKHSALSSGVCRTQGSFCYSFCQQERLQIFFSELMCFKIAGVLREAEFISVINCTDALQV